MYWIDPSSLRKTSGIVDRLIQNPKGLLDGLVFTDGTLIHFPPHMTAGVSDAIEPGDKIDVYGVRPRGADLLAAVSLITAKGKSLVDQGPDAKAEKLAKTPRAELYVEGTVRLSLFGPKGELRGALLDDGSVLRVPPHEAEGVRDLLQSQAMVSALGDGVENAVGRAIDVRMLGATRATMRPMKKKPLDDDKHPGKYRAPHEHAGHPSTKPRKHAHTKAV
jgi:hypothetical protein